MGTWMRGHWWQLMLGLLAVGGWVDHVEGAIVEVHRQSASLDVVSEELRNVKWSLDSLRLELRHMNRALDALLVVNQAR
jgi:hypothetical protein